MAFGSGQFSRNLGNLRWVEIVRNTIESGDFIFFRIIQNQTRSLKVFQINLIQAYLFPLLDQRHIFIGTSSKVALQSEVHELKFVFHNGRSKVFLRQLSIHAILKIIPKILGLHKLHIKY